MWSSGVLVMWKQQRLKLNSRKYISGDLVIVRRCIRTITDSVFGFIVRGGGDLEWVVWGVSKGAAIRLERRRGKDKVRRRREEKFRRKNSEVRVDKR